MKKLNKLLLIMLILVIGTSNINVYANDGLGSLGDAIIGAQEQLTIWGYWKGGLSYFSSPGTGDNVANDGLKCGETALCFNGAGLYIKLIHYDYKTKTEKLVGKPILIHTSSFLNTATVIRKSATEDEIKQNSSSKPDELKDDASCTDTYTYYYEYEELEKYKKEDVSYSIEINGIEQPIDKNNIKFVVDDNLTYGEHGEGISDYVKRAQTGLIAQYASSFQKLKESFSLGDSDLNDLILNSDNYYLVFEPAVREKLSGGGTNGVEQSEPTIKKMSSSVGKDTYVCKRNGVVLETIQPIEVEFGAAAPTSTDCTSSCTTVGKKYKYQQKLKYTLNGEIKTQESDFDTKAACDSSCQGSTSIPGYNSCTCSYVETDSGETFCGAWEREACSTRGVVNNAALKTKVYDGKSKVRPAKFTNKISKVLSVVTVKESTDCNGSGTGNKGNCVMHCVLNKNNECTGKYEYYIGPTLEKSLVGSPDANNGNVFHNKYKLYDKDDKGASITQNTFKNDKYTVGTSYWWIPGFINCQVECGAGTAGTDKRLQCAENYCDNAIGYDDRMNTQKFKHTCITSTCGYTYKTMTCDNESVNPYKNDNDYTIGETTKSTCSILNSDGKTKTEDSKKTITKCEAYDANKDVFDQKTYLIVACKESSSFQYADLSKTRIIAGEGLNYFANLQGGKECTVSFDIDAWKVAYASYHSEDQVCVSGKLDDKGNCIGEVTSSRKLLENVLNYYNKCSLGTYDDEETKKLCDIGGDAIGIDMNGKPVETTWTSLGYNTNKVEVKTSVAEVINDEKVKSENYTLIKNREKTDNSITANKEKAAYSFAYNQRQDFGKVKTYLSTSNVEANYTFDKYCVTTDGKATVYKANADGKCKQDETGIESKEVFGKNVYYTSFNATPTYEITSGNKHAIEYTTATVKNENEMSYLSSQEYCPYEIETNGLSCSIEIELLGATTTHKADIYDGPIKAKLKINNQLGTTDIIVGTGLDIDEQSLNGLTEIEVDMTDSKKGAEIREIYGIVTTKNGKTVTCDKQVKLVEPCNQQIVKCEVSTVSQENKLYEIETNSTRTAFYALTNDIKEYINKNHPLGVGFKGILKEDNKNIVKAYEISESSRLYGMVTDSTGGYCVCWEDIGDRNWNPDIYNCKNEVNRSKVKEVQDFCEQNWQKDVSNYSSSKACIEDCKCEIPPEVNCEIGNITDYCEARYRDCEFEDVSTCINYVYNNLVCPGTEGGNDYIYRPINNSNPFPNSYESPIPGDRIIGGNWVGRTQYITDDSSDSTSVTGANAGVSVEYEINLTPSIIQDIRKNTESYINSGKNPYLDYISVEEGKDGYCLEEGYCSEFINSSEFSTIFKVK